MIDSLLDFVTTAPAEIAVWVAAITALGIALRKGWRKVRLGFRRANSLVDTLVGRPAITHPDRPEEVIVPAQPGLNDRLGAMEGTLSRLVDTTIAKLDGRVDNLEKRLDAHETNCSPVAQVHVEVSPPAN